MNARGMTLTKTSGLSTSELQRVLGAELRGDGGVRVLGVRQDSRAVQPGDLFCARAGGKTSGTAFIEDALAKGAVALLVESGSELPEVSVPVLVVQHVAGRPGRAKKSDTTQMQVRDLDTGELSTARVWGPMRAGVTLVRQGMNVIAQAPPGADEELRRWVERENRRNAH